MKFMVLLGPMFFSIFQSWAMTLSNLDQELKKIFQHQQRRTPSLALPALQEDHQVEQELKSALEQILKGKSADSLNKPFDTLRSRFLQTNAGETQALEVLCGLARKMLKEGHFADYDNYQEVEKIFQSFTVPSPRL